MSSAGNVPKLAKHSRSFMKNKLNKSSKKNTDTNAKGTFQPYQRRSMQCLTTFDCPVCRLRNVVRVDLNAKDQQAIVRCTYCVNVRPRPRDLPYPHTTTFVPKLENRADVFFRFNELYRGLERAAGQGPSGRGMDGEAEFGNGADEGGAPYSGDGVLGLSSLLPAEWTGAHAVDGEDKDDDDGGFDDAQEEEEEDEENTEAKKNVEVKEGNKDGLDDGEVDMDAFFGDSDED